MNESILLLFYKIHSGNELHAVLHGVILAQLNKCLLAE